MPVSQEGRHGTDEPGHGHGAEYLCCEFLALGLVIAHGCNSCFIRRSPPRPVRGATFDHLVGGHEQIGCSLRASRFLLAIADDMPASDRLSVVVLAAAR